MLSFRNAPLLALLLLCLGCTSIGPEKLVPTHAGYNDAVQLVAAREVLLNLVRLRYNDPPQYLTVSSINAQFSVKTQAQVGGAELGAGGGAEVGAGISYSDSPTITFTPEAGFSSYESLGAPLRLDEAIAYIYTLGRLREHEVALVFGSINNAQERLGPRGSEYRENLAAVLRLFDAGATFRHFREFDEVHFVGIPAAKLTARDMAEASKAEVHYYDRGDGTVGLAKLRLAIGMAVPLPHEGEVAAALRELELTPGKAMYPVRSPDQERPEPLTRQPDTLWMTTRSPARILEIATQSVEVPLEHAKQGLSAPDDFQLNTGVTLPLRIHQADEEPSALYRVSHRGKWFYIDDADPESKRLFYVLTVTYQSRVGLDPPDDAPGIVLPIGGN